MLTFVKRNFTRVYNSKLTQFSALILNSGENTDNQPRQEGRFYQ